MLVAHLADFSVYMHSDFHLVADPDGIESAANTLFAVAESAQDCQSTCAAMVFEGCIGSESDALRAHTTGTLTNGYGTHQYQPQSHA